MCRVGGVVEDAVHVVRLGEPHPHVVEIATCKKRDGVVEWVGAAAGD